jgi:hypothetical protein
MSPKTSIFVFLSIINQQSVAMLKVTFDSNAWERAFDPGWREDREAKHIAGIRAALTSGTVAGFICETAFRLETLKNERLSLIGGSEFTVLTFKFHPEPDGMRIEATIGADDRRHPGIHPRQMVKLKEAFQHGFQLVDGQTWAGLSGPALPDWRSHTVPLTGDERARKEERHMDVFYALHDLGVGKAPLDVRIEAMERSAGSDPRKSGWKILEAISDHTECRAAVAEISEWADAEIIASHYGYQHDVLCSEDRASTTKRSAFDDRSRQMLTQQFGIRFASFADLAAMIQRGTT